MRRHDVQNETQQASSEGVTMKGGIFLPSQLEGLRQCRELPPSGAGQSPLPPAENEFVAFYVLQNTSAGRIIRYFYDAGVS